MDVGRAAVADYAGILQLQAANYFERLSAAERGSGFLSAEFTPAQIAAMAQDLGIVVAREEGRVVGYVCAHRADLEPLPPVVETMLRSARGASHGARPLADAALFVYGPVCIARDWRGRGLLRRLYAALLAAVAGRFEFGVTLVAHDNPHSLRAHVQGLGMHAVARFEHAGRGYHLLVFECRRAPPVS